MISSKKELQFYLQADRMMNRGEFVPSWRTRIKTLFVPDYTIQWLRAMRHVSFYKSRTGGGKIQYVKWLRRYKKLSLKLGFSIEPDVFGYGLVVPHYGTIVVGGTNRVGNYAVLHSSSCIADGTSVIGDGLYLSTGAIISSHVELGNNITISANSTVNKSVSQNNVLLVGAPAYVKKESVAWYIRDGVRFQKRHQAVEQLKKTLLS